MRIITFKKADTAYKADTSKIRQTMNNARSRKGKLTNAEKTLRKNMFNLLNIVEELMEESLSLKLSDNNELAQKLNCTPRQAQRAKEELSKLGVLYVPDYGKQKKKGDHPIWHFNFSFLVEIESKAETVEVNKKKSNNTKYKSEYYTIKSKAHKTIIEEIEWEEKEFGEEIVLTDRMYWMRVNLEFQWLLNVNDLTVAELKI